jgi:hypothetical protein
VTDLWPRFVVVTAMCCAVRCVQLNWLRQNTVEDKMKYIVFLQLFLLVLAGVGSMIDILQKEKTCDPCTCPQDPWYAHVFPSPLPSPLLSWPLPPRFRSWPCACVVCVLFSLQQVLSGLAASPCISGATTNCGAFAPFNCFAEAGFAYPVPTRRLTSPSLCPHISLSFFY